MFEGRPISEVAFDATISANRTNTGFERIVSCPTAQIAGLATSIVRRLRAILNMYPPNRSIAAIDISRNAASHLCGVPRSSGFPNITTSETPNGTTEAIPSSTPMKRSLAPMARGIERSWKVRYMSVSHARLKPKRSGANSPEGPSQFAPGRKKPTRPMRAPKPAKCSATDKALTRSSPYHWFAGLARSLLYRSGLPRPHADLP